HGCPRDLRWRASFPDAAVPGSRPRPTLALPRSAERRACQPSLRGGLIRAEPISLSTDRREVRAAGTLDHAPIVEPGPVRRNSGLRSPPDECEIGCRTAARNDECQDGPHKRRTGQRTAAWRDAARVVFLFDLALPHRGNVFAG